MRNSGGSSGEGDGQIHEARFSRNIGFLRVCLEFPSFNLCFRAHNLIVVIVSESNKWSDFTFIACCAYALIPLVVALSRARHGLFMFGNATDLSAQSPMWFEVLGGLRERGALGGRLPIVCHRHSEETRYVDKPGELRALAPDGGLKLFSRIFDNTTKCIS